MIDIFTLVNVSRETFYKFCFVVLFLLIIYNKEVYADAAGHNDYRINMFSSQDTNGSLSGHACFSNFVVNDNSVNVGFIKIVNENNPNQVSFQVFLYSNNDFSIDSVYNMGDHSWNKSSIEDAKNLTPYYSGNFALTKKQVIVDSHVVYVAYSPARFYEQGFMNNPTFDIGTAFDTYYLLHTSLDISDFENINMILHGGHELSNIDGKLIDTDLINYDNSLPTPSKMVWQVEDYACSKNSGHGENENKVRIDFFMYQDEYIPNTDFDCDLTLTYSIRVKNSLSGLDNLKWGLTHPFTKNQQIVDVNPKLHFNVSSEDIQFDEQMEKYKFTVFVDKADIYSAMVTYVSELEYKGNNNWSIVENHTAGGIDLEHFPALKSAYAVACFYDKMQGLRTNYFTFQSNMKLFSNDGMEFTNDDGKTKLTVGEEEIFQYTDKDGNNTEWADNVGFDAQTILDNEKGYSWSSESNHKNFISVLVDIFDGVGQFPTFLQRCFFFLPSWFFQLLGVVFAVLVIARILGR